MLSRSNSNATNRVRRAKSTSSVHTSTSTHQRLPATTDPFVLRQQAETAAIEAYTRARAQDEEASALLSRPRPNRRRSQNTGRSEGSHFAEARRRTIQSEATKPSTSQHSSPAQSRSVGDGETIVTRRRSLVPPAVHSKGLGQLPTASPLRKRASDYTDGSPAPRYSQLEETASILHSRPLQEGQTDGYAGNLDHLSNFAPRDVAQDLSLVEPVPSRSIEVEDFHMFQPKRVRLRKSFLGSFQKRNGGFDTALPPFNYASSEGVAPHAGLSLAAIPSSGMEHRKSRNFSDTLKGRLKKVFRKTSKTSMPVQHIHAKDFHFSIRDNDVSEASFPDYTDPFMTVAAEEPKPQQNKHMTAQSAVSSAPGSSSRSRVTSWTNSTLAVSSIRTNNGPFAVTAAYREPDVVSAEMQDFETSGPTEDAPALKRSDSSATLRKASSFFTRPIRNKLRRSSKQDLKGSGESHGLYSALQSRIETSRSTETANEIEISAPLELATSREQTNPSALATLPSQRQYGTSSGPSSSMKSQGRLRAGSFGAHNRHILSSTIRPVTPELAPVQEAASAEADRTVIHYEVESPAESSPKSALRRSHAVKAPPPSKEQLLRRKERAENRWSTALTTGGLTSLANDNPYELPSLSQPKRTQSPNTGLIPVSRADVISPSLYSRATDGASPRPDTPDDVGLTTITITGREVRKYDISPPKHSHRHQTSRDWRKWLSGEMDSFANHEQPSRPASGASMNGRYPAIDRSRNSSQQSVSRRSADEDSQVLHSMTRNRHPSIESAMYAQGPVAASRNRTLSKPKSIAEIESTAVLELPPKSDSCSPAAGPTVRAVKGFNRPRSAFELRVNYKNNATNCSKPWEVRRKAAEPSILEDHTMLNIYAGPYASISEDEQPVELEGSGIPALSSSEWLGSTKKGVRKPSSKSSPIRHSPQRSPGQRMVTSWLDERSKENVAAFV